MNKNNVFSAEQEGAGQPGGPILSFEGSPESYTGPAPTAMPTMIDLTICSPRLGLIGTI